MASCILIIPSFFDYPKVITDGLAKVYSEVLCVNSTRTDKLYKFVSYFGFNKIKQIIVDIHFRKIQNDLVQNMPETDMIIVVRGSLIPQWFYEWMNSYYSKAKKVEYLWDNIENDPRALSVSKHFDKILSFSMEDCKKYGFTFRPFFFVSKSNIPQKEIDLTCIVSLSKDRAITLNNILHKNTFLSSCNLFWHIKGSRALLFKYRKIIGQLKKFCTSRALNYTEMIRILEISKAQIDIPKPKQSGLTTRAFEALGTRTKIITTNTNIRKYDFYNKHNILIIDKDNPIINEEWLDKPYVELPKDTLERYSLNSFIKDLTNL